MSWQKDRATQVAQLKKHCIEIEAKLNTALEALSEVSRGYGTGTDEKHQFNIQRLAANAMVKIGQMKQTEKPYIWWA